MPDNTRQRNNRNSNNDNFQHMDGNISQLKQESQYIDHLPD